LLARRKDRLEALAEQIRQRFPDCRSVHIAPVDVRHPAEIQAALEALPAELRDIDILINNAGLVKGITPTYANTLADIDEIIDTNVKGMLYVLRAVVPRMKDRSQGTIINISSIAGTEAYKNGSIYCASKHAVHALTIALRKELISYPIRVCMVSPGLTNTEFTSSSSPHPEHAEPPSLDYVPLRAVDIADNIAYIASRPPHVQIADILVLPTCQASSEALHRGPLIGSTSALEFLERGDL
jgi:NADP-dependent 3-hydroxy acid dehydrogenase YdfG